jgi:transcriptional regulator with XRE-family HTH domain
MLKYKVKQVELCRKLGVSTTYVSEVLNGHRPHKNALIKFNSALDELIAEKENAH